MSEALLVALIGFAVKYGIPAAITFFQNRGTTIDEAIDALAKAHAKSLEDYIAEDAAAMKPKVPPSGGPPATL
jgi:hypothetical protein